jgi:TonB family protein
MMTTHFTDDQAARFILGASTMAEREHHRTCSVCGTATENFHRMLTTFRGAVSGAALRRTAGNPPDLGRIAAGTETKPVYTSILGEPVEAFPVRLRYAAGMSLLVHAAVVGLLAVPLAFLKAPAPTETSVVLLHPPPLVMDVRNARGGGGGGGMPAERPPSQGVPPRGADLQLTPPVLEVKNLMPELAVEPTLVAPQLQDLPRFSISMIGDPNGIAGPPSPGPGTGGGIGTGNGRGVSGGDGPGLGPGSGGGPGGEVFGLRGGVSNPRILFRPPPEYTEDARKARAQGTVEMIVIVQRDGTVTFESFTRRVGYGLDEKALEAVRRWSFDPARRDGIPVPMRITIEVNFVLH